MTENAEHTSSDDPSESVSGTGVPVGQAPDAAPVESSYPSVAAQLAEQRVQLQTLQANFARLREMVEALERAIATSKAEPVSPEQEIAKLQTVLGAMTAAGFVRK